VGNCSDEVRVLLALGVFGVLLIWVGVAVAWTSALRVLRISRAIVTRLDLDLRIIDARVEDLGEISRGEGPEARRALLPPAPRR
jgi:hypothetical protein